MICRNESSLIPLDSQIDELADLGCFCYSPRIQISAKTEGASVNRKLRRPPLRDTDEGVALSVSLGV